MPFEQSLIFHCSPTLASLKMASLFSFDYQTEEELMENLAYWNEEMREKGISLILMRKKKQNALIYVYRRSRLEVILKEREIRRFLQDYGYGEMDLGQSLGHLKERLGNQEGFPHEIGIFLGYPLEDVVGFIRNKGKNFLVSGLWKVYGNREESVKIFGKYKKCTEVYVRMWNSGRSVRQLTVSV
jgi:hypothetical protein